MKIFFTIIKFAFLSRILMGQAFEGMTLFSPTQGGGAASHATYLMDNDLNIIHSWTHSKGAASMAYLRKDSKMKFASANKCHRNRTGLVHLQANVIAIEL